VTASSKVWPVTVNQKRIALKISLRLRAALVAV
jgi:hypothetical protein